MCSILLNFSSQYHDVLAPVHLLVCLFLSRGTQKLENRFPWNLVEGWDMWRKRTHFNMGQIQEFFINSFLCYCEIRLQNGSCFKKACIFRGLISMSGCSVGQQWRYVVLFLECNVYSQKLHLSLCPSRTLWIITAILLSSCSLSCSRMASWASWNRMITEWMLFLELSRNYFQSDATMFEDKVVQVS